MLLRDRLIFSVGRTLPTLDSLATAWRTDVVALGSYACRHVSLTVATYRYALSQYERTCEMVSGSCLYISNNITNKDDHNYPKGDDGDLSLF